MNATIQIATSALFAASLFVGGCKAQPKPAAAAAAAAHKADDHAAAPAAAAAAPAAAAAAAPAAAPAPTAVAAPVTVAPKGTNFDPPVEIASLPTDAWYCDMGKSHYARMEKGDATCPRCKMALKHKVAH